MHDERCYTFNIIVVVFVRCDVVWYDRDRCLRRARARCATFVSAELIIIIIYTNTTHGKLSTILLVYK